MESLRGVQDKGVQKAPATKKKTENPKQPENGLSTTHPPNLPTPNFGVPRKVDPCWLVQGKAERKLLPL